MSINSILTERSVKDIITSIERTFNSMQQRIDALETENAELKSACYKDKVVANLVAENERLSHEANLGFPISEEENIAINAWIKQHETEHSGGHGCSGGKYTYIFVPTGIGTVARIKCNCGAEFEFQHLG